MLLKYLKTFSHSCIYMCVCVSVSVCVCVCVFKVEACVCVCVCIWNNQLHVCVCVCVCVYPLSVKYDKINWKWYEIEGRCYPKSGEMVFHWLKQSQFSDIIKKFNEFCFDVFVTTRFLSVWADSDKNRIADRRKIKEIIVAFFFKKLFSR